MNRIYFDGSSQPSENGKMRTCLVAILDNVVEIKETDVGIGNSLIAEQEALLDAVRFAKEQKLESVELIGDCQSVIELLSKNKLVEFCFRFENEAAGIPVCTIHWIHRHANLAGHYLDGGNSSMFKMNLWLRENILVSKIK